jgi:hypothetical protein
VPDCTQEEYQRGKNPDFGANHKGGILYVIDEIHVDFDRRAWAAIGMGLTYYMSQERKLCDDQVFTTPFLKLVDSRLVLFCQEFIVCRNWGYEKFLTVFSKGGGMEARHYSQPPAEGKMGDYPNEVHRYKLDLRLAVCYDTNAGVGFVGKAGVAKIRKGGLPIWTMFLGAAAAAVVLWFGTDLLGAGIMGKSGTVKRFLGAPQARISGPSPQPMIFGRGGDSPPVGGEVVTPPRGDTSQRGAAVEPEKGENPVYREAVRVVGIAVLGRRVRVTFDDGTIADESTPGLTRVDSRCVTINGRRYALQARSSAGGGVSAAAKDLPSVGPMAGLEPAKAVGSGSVAPSPAGQDEGDWLRGSDGVARLKSPEHLGH